MLAGSATVFFAYVGFDTVASAAEEVCHPKYHFYKTVEMFYLV